MRAVVVEEFGPPEVPRVRDVDPAPGPGDVLIAIEAAGVNRAGALGRAAGV